MWHETHRLPALSDLWCVCASRLDTKGPVWAFGAWQVRQRELPFARSIDTLSFPWGSWHEKHVTPRVYIRLWTKSLPCIRFLCDVPSGNCVKLVSPGLEVSS